MQRTEETISGILKGDRRVVSLCGNGLHHCVPVSIKNNFKRTLVDISFPVAGSSFCFKKHHVYNNKGKYSEIFSLKSCYCSFFCICGLSRHSKSEIFSEKLLL